MNYRPDQGRLMEWSGRAPAPPAIETGKGRQRQAQDQSCTQSTALDPLCTRVAIPYADSKDQMIGARSGVIDRRQANRRASVMAYDRAKTVLPGRPRPRRVSINWIWLVNTPIV
jgi:hypothetical protein